MPSLSRTNIVLPTTVGTVQARFSVSCTLEWTSRPSGPAVVSARLPSSSRMISRPSASRQFAFAKPRSRHAISPVRMLTAVGSF